MLRRVVLEIQCIPRDDQVINDKYGNCMTYEVQVYGAVWPFFQAWRSAIWALALKTPIGGSGRLD